MAENIKKIYYTVKEVSAMSGFSQQKIYRWVKYGGVIPKDCIKRFGAGKKPCLRFFVGKVNAWLAL